MGHEVEAKRKTKRLVGLSRCLLNVAWLALPLMTHVGVELQMEPALHVMKALP
jgi:hypothetical protein